MATTYDKLIRDRVPLRILDSGAGMTVVVETDPAKLFKYTVNKFYEEMTEYLGGPLVDPDEHVTIDRANPDELSDLYEVLVAMAAQHGMSEDALLRNAREKRNSHGGFKRGLILKETT